MALVRKSTLVKVIQVIARHREAQDSAFPATELKECIEVPDEWPTLVEELESCGIFIQEHADRATAYIEGDEKELKRVGLIPTKEQAEVMYDRLSVHCPYPGEDDPEPEDLAEQLQNKRLQFLI